MTDWPLVVFLGLAGLLLFDKIWRQVLVVHFFRKPLKPFEKSTRFISILQPIVSGDPALQACLEHSLAIPCSVEREIFWLVDDADAPAHRLCEELIAEYPHLAIRMVLTPPPLDRCSPKMVKLVAGMKLAQGDVICVLDDDTTLPAGGLESCLPYLEEPGAGLVFGLPYYISFDNFWSSLVACFVNSHSLATYVPYTYLANPVTINGMFYIFKRNVYDETGGFESLIPICADDFAVAKHFREKGYRLIQSPMRHAIRTTVNGPGTYFRLLHRWFTFPRETLMKSLPWNDRLLALVLGLGSAFGPVAFVLGLIIWPWTLVIALSYAALHFLAFLHFHFVYLHRATPWYWAWLVPLVQILLPIQLAIALVTPQRINWRGHIMKIESGGSFHFISRRPGA